MPHSFDLVDVFGDGDFSGNPLAVIADAADLDGDLMQQITRWLNLSETTFLLPPTTEEADYRVRIFSLSRELAFAGHPTLGTCHAWLAAGGRPKDGARIVQQCGAGLVPIIRSEGGLAFAAPPLVRSGPVEAAARDEIAAILRLDPAAIVDAQWVDNGPGWVAVLLGSAEAVLAVAPARHHATPVDIGVVGPHPGGHAVAFELRAFFSDHHGVIVEDPVTGSLNASVAQWLLASGRARAPYWAAQGRCIGRNGRIRVETDRDGRVWIGGKTRTLFRGTAEV